MQATTVETLALFEPDVRYLVPIYQRNYRWKETQHWDPLWSDIRDVADEILELGDGPDVADHFLGAIVCEQLQVFGRDAHAVALIDGQQRLTTLQLFIAAVTQIAERRGFESAAYVRRLIENHDVVVKGRSEHRYKVLPNLKDRAAFSSAMASGSGDSLPEKAVRFFRKTIETWLDLGDEDDPLDDAAYSPDERMEALVSAVARHLKLVKIDLEKNDNAQIIFETLNARGERLTDADLIRNHLFRMAEEQGRDAAALHEEHWAEFDRGDHWTRSIAHGRHQRERLELLLNYWLSMRRNEEVPAARIFPVFKEYVGQQGLMADAVAADIAHHARVFDSFESQEPDSQEWWFFRRVSDMDLITVYPAVLWLFAQPKSALPPDQRTLGLTALESFLVRRLIRRDSTRSYGDVFVSALQAAADGPGDEAGLRIVQLLASNTADADRWPRDDEILAAVLNTNVYKLKQSRLVMVLSAIERSLVRDGRAEVVQVGGSLWIEHLLPQTWRTAAAWQLPSDVKDPVEAALHRDHILHTLGNLTLTTAKVDIELSNKPWDQKLSHLERHSALALNRDVIDRYRDGWDEARIRERGRQLSDAIVLIWPGPEAMLRDIQSGLQQRG